MLANLPRQLRIGIPRENPYQIAFSLRHGFTQTRKTIFRGRQWPALHEDVTILCNPHRTGWEAWIRTRVPCSKGMCPTTGRPPKTEAEPGLRQSPLAGQRLTAPLSRGVIEPLKVAPLRTVNDQSHEPFRVKAALQLLGS